MKSILGGSWDSKPRHATVGVRYRFEPVAYNRDLGLRLARSPMQQAQKGARDE